MVFRLALLARDDVIDVDSVADTIGTEISTGSGAPDSGFGAAIDGWLAENGNSQGTLYHAVLASFEKPLFEHALRMTEGNQLRAAQLLGINRNTLRKRLGELDIAPEDFARRR